MNGPTPLDQSGCADLLGVSRETLEPCRRLIELLRHWQPAINLVGPSTLSDPWRRHILDSAQLVRHLPSARSTVVDLGSGAGFPGLVLATLTDHEVHLVESDARKVQFLREARRVLELEVALRHGRIEALAACPTDVVTARALAPLDRLLALGERFITPRTRCLFLKSGQIERELTAVAPGWHMDARCHVSLSDPRGVVLQLEDVHRAAHPQA